MVGTPVVRYRVVCLLGACLLLAGCQGFVGADGGATDTPTVTPAPVPGEATGGVSVGVTDPDRLAARHRQVLSRTNYTLALTERLVIDGEPRRVTIRRRQVGADARSYLVARTERTDEFAPSNYAGITGYWYNGSTELMQYAGNTGRQYAAAENPGAGLLDDPTEHRAVAGMVRAFDTASATRRQSPNGSLHVHTSNLSRPSRIPELGYFVAPRNGTLHVTIAPRGYVAGYRVAYNATIAGTDREVRVIREMTVTRVGRTPVHPPDWAGAAWSNAGSG